MNEIALTSLALKKASRSHCAYKICAIGLNKKGEVVSKTTNIHRFSRKGGGVHAEMRIMSAARKKGVKTILIARVGKSGIQLPIHPCRVCADKAKDLGIKIISL
jgi:cytidine deaminase